jgi:hypothetical protein
MTRSRHWAAAGCVLTLALSATACGDDPAPAAAPRASADSSPAPASPATFHSETFSVPFDVDVPAWLPAEPSVEETRFVTWESTSEDRKVRVLLPISVYRPGDTYTTPPPVDYLTYLREQAASGAEFTDETAVEVAGRSATLVTAGTDRAIDGSLGCPADGMTATDCFGLQPDLLLRLAVVPLDAGTLLIWARGVLGDPGIDEQFADFDEMLTSLELR